MKFFLSIIQSLCLDSLQMADYGFPAPTDAELDDEERQQFQEEQSAKRAWRGAYMHTIATQSQQWNKRLEREHRYDKLPDLKEICRAGIPAARRANAWWTLSGAQELYRKDPQGYGTVIFELLCSTLSARK
jgi:hypothetical protein